MSLLAASVKVGVPIPTSRHATLLADLPLGI